MRAQKQTQRGDTLIEVLIATTVLAIIVVTAIVLMNRGMASSQVAVETTIVRQSIDGQAEMLRHLADSKINEPDSAAAQKWNDFIQDHARYNNTTPTDPTAYGTCPPNFGNTNYRFYMAVEGNNVEVKDYPNGAKADIIAEPGKGIWIEATRTRPTTTVQTFTDFHIRACWDSPVASSPQLTMGTVVRLYAP